MSDLLKLAPCPHRPACPGCPRFGLSGLAPETFRQLQQLAQLAQLPEPSVHEGQALGFRYRARLAVRGRAKNPKLGIFELGSHQVVHIPNCPIHHPAINTAARTIRHALVDHGILPYSDQAHAGSVRYVQIAVERSSGRVQVVIVTRDDERRALAPFLDSLRDQLGPSLQGLFWNLQPERSNTILGSEFRRWAGADALCESFAGVHLFFPPGAFGQSHLDLAEQIALRVRELSPRGARVAEFYAGVGALGLPLVEQSQHVACNEVAEASLQGLARGVQALPEALQSRVHVHPGTAASGAGLLRDSDVVIVDPPRKGLDRGLLDGLLATPPKRLIYVSCGLPALLREAGELVGSGQFALTTLEAYSLFPYTEHVETLAVFDRQSSL